MAGTPIKHERNRIVRAAIMRAMKDGQEPEDFMKPFTDKLQELALGGDLSAMRELFDRVEGKPQAALELSGSPDEPLRIVHESK